MADLKISLRKRGATNFETGDRLLPVTHYNYVEGLIAPDGKISPSLIPAWLYNNRVAVGIAELGSTPSPDISEIFADSMGFDIDINDPVSALQGVQGYFVEVTQAGTVTNTSPNSDMFELVGNGNAGNNEFPITLETGDYILIVKVNETNPKFSLAIVDNVYGDATTTNKGIVKLYDGVDNSSNVLAATAGAVKQAYDLATTKENAFTKNSAFNKNFTTSGGLNGTAVTVARGDHKHGTYSRATDKLVGLHVFDDIIVNDGIVTGATTRVITRGELAMTMIDDGLALHDVTWSGDYLDGRFDTVEGTASTAITLAKKGIEFYNNIAAANDGGHATGDIVIVQEA